MLGLIEHTIEDENGCWIWQKYINNNGYAIYGSNTLAHRVAYERYIGFLGDKHVHHKCGVRSCINPIHLQAVDPKDHVRIELELKGKSHLWKNRVKNLPTHCKHGHEFTEENTYRWKSIRQCRACNTRRGKEAFVRRKEWRESQPEFQARKSENQAQLDH